MIDRLETCAPDKLISVEGGKIDLSQNIVTVILEDAKGELCDEGISRSSDKVIS